MSTEPELRLNLGCGSRQLPGFVNVDAQAACEPDRILDLEDFPWPFDDDSVVEVRMSHVLEHLGQDPKVYLQIFTELYRVCRSGAEIHIQVPHPRHDHFLADPTHVRPVTLEGLSLLSRQNCLAWQSAGYANTPLAIYLEVDFEIRAFDQKLDPAWAERLDAGEVDEAEVMRAAKTYHNVIEETSVVLGVVKETVDGVVEDDEARARRYLAAGDTAAAVTAALAAAEAHPDQAALWHLAGTAMYAQDQGEGATLGFRQAVAVDPSYTDAWADLGLVLRRAGQFDEALDAVDQALAIDPDHVLAANCRGGLLFDLDRPDEAARVAADLAAAHPGDPRLLANHGNALRKTGDLAGAIAAHEACISLDPSQASHHWNLAYALFQAGRYREGFAAAEQRVYREGVPTPPWIDRMWTGEVAAGETVLLEAEQGLGDTLQFVRFAEDVAALGARVVIAAPPRLIPLLRTAAGVDDVVPKGTEVPHDHVALLMSLPAILGLDEAGLRREGAYLTIPDAAVAAWQGRLPEGFRIGVCWQGNPDHDEDHHRSFPLDALAPVAAIPGVTLVSLQHGPGTDPIAAAPFPLHQLPAGIDADGAFVDTAAVMHHLDLVITCDSAVGHLAGALGRPCAVALAAAPCWRWALGERKTPWYERHRAWTQPSPGAWAPVFEGLAAMLTARLGQ